MIDLFASPSETEIIKRRQGRDRKELLETIPSFLEYLLFHPDGFRTRKRIVDLIIEYLEPYRSYGETIDVFCDSRNNTEATMATNMLNIDICFSTPLEKSERRIVNTFGLVGIKMVQ